MEGDINMQENNEVLFLAVIGVIADLKFGNCILLLDSEK